MQEPRKGLATLALPLIIQVQVEAHIIKPERQPTEVETFLLLAAEALPLIAVAALKDATLVEQQRLVLAQIEEKTRVHLELIPIFVVAVKETIAFSKGLKELCQEIVTQLELIPTLVLITEQTEVAQAIGLILLVVLPIAAHPLALAQAEAADLVTAEVQVAPVAPAEAQVEEVAAEAVLVAQVEVVLAEDDN